ncbi:MULTISPECIES: hypothetical protein [unclassified Psychrobacter]|uniref:hypothetical protein n=1 Tax=unclassified Psychrobacter TaxID=196806 RepID=UPI003F46AA9F
MLNNIDLYPTLHEQKLLQQKAAQHNMSVTEFIAAVIRKAISDKDDKDDTDDTDDTDDSQRINN